MYLSVSSEVAQVYARWTVDMCPETTLALDLALLEEIYAHLPDRLFSGRIVRSPRHPVVSWLHADLRRWAYTCQELGYAPATFLRGLYTCLSAVGDA